MIDLLSVYNCPKCGKVLEDQVSWVDSIDTENDDVYEIATCDRCHREVSPTEEFEQVDHERWLWASGFYNDLMGEEL